MASVSCETMRHFCTLYRDSCVQPQSVPCERAPIITRHQDKRRIKERNSNCFSQELEHNKMYIIHTTIYRKYCTNR